MKTLDARGLKCPMPLIETKKALIESEEGTTLKIVIDNETSVKNVTHYLEDNGIPVNTVRKDDTWEIVVNNEGLNIADSQPEEYCEIPTINNKSYVVLFAKNKIGEGSDELGKKLVGSLLESLKAQDILPDKIIFMNSGIDLVVKGSPYLPLLVELEVNGVEMVSCGTCLSYFNKMDELEIGRVSNMFEIVEKMRNAGQIINV